MQGCQMPFAKLPGFVNSARSELCGNSQAAQGKQRQSVLLNHN